MQKDTWNPAQYERFKEQRQEPVNDLLALIQPRPMARAVDLGCGTGELTALLHERRNIGQTTGIDRSAAMLEKAAAFTRTGLKFEQGTIEDWTETAGIDLLFSNAALQWTSNHPALFSRFRDCLSVGGQLAVQMPANHDHLSHRLAGEIAQQAPFSQALAGYVRLSPVLPVEEYATMLHGLGFSEVQALTKVYGHQLSPVGDLVEWVKGTLLTDYEARLPAALFAQFLERYSRRLNAALGEGKYFYAFKRTILWALR